MQDDAYAKTESVVVCPTTTEQITTEFLRPSLEPNEANGLLVASRVMVDKVAALPRGNLRERIGLIDDDKIRQVETALMTFLGMAR